MRKYIAYYRVSTKDQELGLESQRLIIERFIESEKQRSSTLSNPSGEPMCLLAEFQDIETGKFSNPNREGLNNAVKACRNLLSKKDEVILLIAKLDRLSRNLTFISTLMDSGVKFIACDMPDANNFTIHIFAALAQQEVGMISKRTKDALEAKVKNNPNGWVDKNGVLRTQLGNPSNFNEKGRLNGGLSKKKKALMDENNIRARNYSKVLRDSGKTLSEIANKLNTDGFRTVEGKSFTGMQIKRLLDSLNQVSVTE